MVAFFHASNKDRVPFYPDEGDRILTFEEVVESLNKKCRFNGHVPGWWSVLDHSVGVSYIAEERCRRNGLTRRATNLICLAALMHDFGEAVIGDITSPQKRLIGKDCALWEIEEFHAKTFFSLALAHQKKTEEDLLIEGFHPLDHPFVKRSDLDAVVTEFIQIYGIDRERASTYGGEWNPVAADWIGGCRSNSLDAQMQGCYNVFLNRFRDLHGRPW